MKKIQIHLNENELNRLIKESVKRVVNEISYLTPINRVDLQPKFKEGDILAYHPKGAGSVGYLGGAGEVRYIYYDNNKKSFVYRMLPLNGTQEAWFYEDELSKGK